MGKKVGIDIPIRVGELFAGYGGASFALKNSRLKYETVFFSEIDKYAIQCYEQNHEGTIRHNGKCGLLSATTRTIKNYGDCTKINPNDLPDFDLLTGGFPCQSFSIAGKGLGELDTRGTLFHEIIRIAEVKKPKYMLLENVKGLTFKNNKDTFDKILSELAMIGYLVKWKILNSKDYGIPQNRERVYFVCFKNKKDFDNYNWPGQRKLIITLKELLENNVDDKYFIKEEDKIKLINKNKNYFLSGKIYKNGDCGSGNRIFKENSILPTQQGQTRTKIIIPCLTPTRLNKRQMGRRFKEDGDPSFTINTQDRHGVLIIDGSGHKIRKLTPKESFRLMGFLSDQINLDNISDYQKYKLAGNGWDINLVSKIFKQMFIHKKEINALGV